MFCDKCGSSVNEGARNCPVCGAVLGTSGSYPPPVAAGIAGRPTSGYPAQPVYPAVPPAYGRPMAYEDTAPLGVKDYLLTFILMGIPFLNFILLLVWGFGSKVNLNKKNLAKAYLILYVISIVFAVLAGVLIMSFAPGILKDLGGF